MQTKDIITISVGDELYPHPFSQVKPPPLQFYALGNTDLLTARARLAIVGSRRMTAYGKQVTDEIARSVAANGIIIVSGLAYGVDITAHKAALEVGAAVIAVLPGSISSIYPAKHSAIAKEIVATGGLLISEYDCSDPPHPFQFVARNRLIAALSHVTLVTEAAKGSGALHTAEFADQLGLAVGAIPGSIYNPQSAGSNDLFKGYGQPISNLKDLYFLLGVNEKIMKPSYKAANSFEKTIIKLLDGGFLSTEDLISKTGYEASSIQIHLTMLEIKGVIKKVNGFTWKLA